MNQLQSSLTTLFNINHSVSQLINGLQPAALIAARFYVAWVFFASGLTKIDDWETTLFLFELEYAVPLLSPVMAAWLGTAGELVFPVLLAFGLFGRMGAIGLSAVNIMAVLSLSEIAPAAYTLHLLWGALLAGVVLFGPGKFSIDTVTGADK